MFVGKIDAFMEEYLKTHKFMGAVRVTVRDDIIYERFFGYADVDRKIPIRRDTLFSFYSMTKPFTAIGLMLLCDKGLVSLDAHPSLYVPECSAIDKRLTVRMLLNHTSGLPDFELTPEFCERYAPGTPEKVREHIRLISEYPMLFEPGTNAKYENINFILAALIIENVSGIGYADYMKERVLKPLGAKTAYVDSYSPFVCGGAVGYEESNGGLSPINRGTDWMLGAGDIVGTLDDAYVLNTAYKEKLLLSEEAWREILSPSPINNMGLGNTVNVWHGKKRIAHNGGHLGFRTLHTYLPEYDFDIIILSNCGFGNARIEIGNGIHNAYFGDDSEVTNEYKMDAGYIKNL